MRIPSAMPTAPSCIQPTARCRPFRPYAPPTTTPSRPRSPCRAGGEQRAPAAPQDGAPQEPPGGRHPARRRGRPAQRVSHARLAWALTFPMGVGVGQDGPARPLHAPAAASNSPCRHQARTGTQRHTNQATPVGSSATSPSWPAAAGCLHHRYATLEFSAGVVQLARVLAREPRVAAEVWHKER